MATVSGGDTLFIAEGSSKLVKVHPSVLFSILDHFIRRPEGQKRVIGTLLGVTSDDGSTIEVVNCFAVPHSEKQEEVAVGQTFNRTMYNLHSAVNKKEQIVGWYATSMDGSLIVDSSSLIHDFYAQECEDPIHLVVDTALTDSTVGVKAYVSTPLVIADEDFANMFHQVKVEMVSSEPERICIDRMLKGQDAPFTSSEALSSLGHELQSLEGSMQRLLGMIEGASDYVDKVVSGEEKADNETGRRIADTLASVPRIRPEVFDKIFNDNLQDLLMVSYLSSLTKSQLAIAERLNAAM
mmetsp:Transcript_30217/g.70059  ORF Transcript_30217/g.70059 Transcript_30217/m.70059 type:complete len:296 (+) Transcript_30217:130-1017(+)|eukprot:CAMPEP_0182533116 /NCGR_PEP_ID=MMETSP1323-20130603/13099_1 /TAXON_ID=236787 /ORGANISM="Florenciella parvula, Strain RCC1693" /LENGTH=295 /DNA_ID=CAMNT_0024742957 /DNA_START=64 /DNA_END=951 /DNA_ORIENTATION=+